MSVYTQSDTETKKEHKRAHKLLKEPINVKIAKNKQLGFV